MEGAENAHERIDFRTDGNRGGKRRADDCQAHRAPLGIQRKSGSYRQETKLNIVVVNAPAQKVRVPEQDRRGDDAYKNQNDTPAHEARALHQSPYDQQNTQGWPDKTGDLQRLLRWQEYVEP